MNPRQLRVLRGASASAAATLLAAVSHTFGGGAAPAPLLVVGMAALLALPAAAVMGRRLSLPRLAATTMITQGAFHVVFAALGAPSSAAAVHSAHDHDAHLAALATEHASLAAQTDGAMLVAHAAAALVTTALLWRGEHAVRAIAGWARAVIRRVPVAVALPVAVAPAAVAAEPTRPASRLFHDVRLQRGPPLVLS
ncbi:hypothetical protein [Microbacterium gilvum]|uniref:MFS transporter n=1 Tax=Microbacterium gilvum TaxID=1336204 RepID=A0ABP9ACJ7_9MICO